jgi:hypothetical protein
MKSTNGTKNLFVSFVIIRVIRKLEERRRPMIRIRSKKDGFRRCGIAHSEKPVDYPDDRFSKKQIAELKAEPMLFVEELPDPPEKKK